MGEIARQVGYRSASAFSVAFTREVGVSPARYARDTHALPGMAAGHSKAPLPDKCPCLRLQVVGVLLARTFGLGLPLAGSIRNAPHSGR